MNFFLKILLNRYLKDKKVKNKKVKTANEKPIIPTSVKSCI